MGDKSNLDEPYLIEENRVPTLYNGTLGGEDNDNKPVTYGEIKKIITDSSEIITGKMSLLGHDTSEFNLPKASETSLANTSENQPYNVNENQPQNSNENQPPNTNNILEGSNITNNIGEISNININLNAIPKIRIKNKSYFKSGSKIADFLNNKNNYNNENFNNCENCNVNNRNAFYCTLCKKSLCSQCRYNYEICHHNVINLLEKFDEADGIVKEIKNNTIYNILFKHKKEQSKEKSDKIYDAKDLNIDTNKEIIDEDIDKFKEQNDIKLIKRILKVNYVNYIHYQNIVECKNYLENRYQECSGKSCLIINYNIQGFNIGSKIRIFGDYFFENNSDKFFLIINNKKSELTPFTKTEDNYLEVILVKKTENIITDLSCMFEDCICLDNIEEYKGHNLIDFNDVEDISYMFKGCTRLTKFDLTLFGSFNGKKLKSMVCTFSECSNLKEIKGIAQWNTENVKTMASMFNRCLKLTNIEGIQNLNTKNVTDFSNMFCRCENLNIPDISKWNMKKAENLSGMFQECKSVIKLSFISQWEIKNVTIMKEMFNGCSVLISPPDFSQWDMSKLTNIEDMFRGCIALTSFPDYKRWKNIQRRVRTTGIFDGCPNHHI